MPIGFVITLVVIAVAWLIREWRHARRLAVLAASANCILQELMRERAGNDEWVRIAQERNRTIEELAAERDFWRVRAEAAA